MDDVTRTLSDRDVRSRGDTSADTVATFNSRVDPSVAVASLEAARQARNHADLQRWIGSVLVPIREFLRLPKGWDSYQGQPLKLETGMFAIQLLGDIMNPRVPIPLIGPTPPGGLQIEWYHDQFELELSINAPNDCEVLFRDRTTGDEQAFQFATDLKPLMALISKIQMNHRVAA